MLGYREVVVERECGYTEAVVESVLFNTGVVEERVTGCTVGVTGGHRPV